jgi:hypothetical protein
MNDVEQFRSLKGKKIVKTLIYYEKVSTVPVASNSECPRCCGF